MPTDLRSCAIRSALEDEINAEAQELDGVIARMARVATTGQRVKFKALQRKCAETKTKLSDARSRLQAHCAGA